MDHPGAIVEVVLDDNLADEFLDLEGRQRRHLRRDEMAADSLITDGGHGQDEITHLERAVQPPAHAEKEHRLGLDGAEHLDHHGRSRGPDLEIDHADIFAGIVHCRKGRAGGNFRAGAFLKDIEIFVKIGEDDILLKIGGVGAGITLEHIPGDPALLGVVIDQIVLKGEAEVGCEWLLRHFRSFSIKIQIVVDKKQALVAGRAAPKSGPDLKSCRAP